MPKVESKEELPEGLKPFKFHGVDFTYKDGAKQAWGQCPVCGKEGKFSIEAETSKASCKACGWAGNNYEFIRWLWQSAYENTEDYEELVSDRGYMSDAPLRAWGVAKHPLRYNEWMIPGYGPGGAINQLYRYARIGDKKRLILTPGFGHALFMPVGGINAAAKEVYVCEGPWDAMALWEVMGLCGMDGVSVVPAASPARSLLAKAAVVAVAGCNVPDKVYMGWSKAFEAKAVSLVYDNDHPRFNEKTKQWMPPAAFTGLQSATASLYAAKKTPESVSRLKWGHADEHGFEFDDSLPSGFDIRDAFGEYDLNGRAVVLTELMSRIEPVPADWVAAAEQKKTKRKTGIHIVKCESYKAMNQSWRKAMKWTDGLNHTLACMLACVTSTRAIGSQLWIKVIGPPSCGKTSLADALSANPKYVMSVSNMKGFHSGYKEGSDDGDNSLISKIDGMTLITKDGDTLLQAGNCDQILAEARDLYDGSTSAHFKNKIHREYKGLRVTWILCGTSALRVLDGSELGERFLDVVVMDGIDDELEDEILEMAAMKATKAMAYESEEEASSHSSPEKIVAHQLTAGYVNYLRENANRLLSEVTLDPAMRRYIIRLAKFVAYMRARPSKRQDETAEREFAARLVEQHIRMALCLAVVFNKKEVDAQVMRHVTKVAMDTARGNTLELVKIVGEFGDEGISTRRLALRKHFTDHKVNTLMGFLRGIGAVETFSWAKLPHMKGEIRWKLTPVMTKLWADVQAALSFMEDE